MSAPLHIAIDGPVAAGKGDIAARLAKELEITYIYTGAMYRALALACIRTGLSTKDANQVVSILEKSQISLAPTIGTDASACRVFLDGVDVTERVTEPDVAAGSSDVAAISRVREMMVELQQRMARGTSVVMEGRDIGLRVLPEAQLKIYLTASLEERSRRRQQQWESKGIYRTYAETLADTQIRDEQDMNRATDPLQKLSDAWELDTTGMTQAEVITAIKKELEKRALIPMI